MSTDWLLRGFDPTCDGLPSTELLRVHSAAKYLAKLDKASGVEVGVPTWCLVVGFMARQPDAERRFRSAGSCLFLAQPCAGIFICSPGPTSSCCCC